LNGEEIIKRRDEKRMEKEKKGMKKEKKKKEKKRKEKERKGTRIINKMAPQAPPCPGKGKAPGRGAR